MAYVWIGSIRHVRMSKTVAYAVNPVKTAYERSVVEDVFREGFCPTSPEDTTVPQGRSCDAPFMGVGQPEASMTANIAYALNPEKGTTKLFQTAINLDSIETAWDEMRATKERWDKADGIQGYHLVQSFAPGEASPELAHRIGVELVERCFPDYEAVVGTHLDKQHIHNHIVLNSVRYTDGHKYHSTVASYYKELRVVSDELCRKYGLSVIRPKEKEGSRKTHAEWQADNAGQQTWCSAIREDIDAVVLRSRRFEDVVRQLRNMGYEVKTNVKYIAVRPPGKERFTRLRRLGDDYTEEALRRRILQNDPQDMPPPIKREKHIKPHVHRVRYRGKWNGSKKSKVGGLRGLYLWYAFRMGNIKRSGAGNRRTHYLLREDLRKLEKRERMASLLVKNQIETVDELHAHRDSCKEMTGILTAERAGLWKQARTDEVNTRLEEIKERLQVLRKEVRTCDEIEQDAAELSEKRKTLQNTERENRQVKQHSKPHRSRRDMQREF